MPSTFSYGTSAGNSIFAADSLLHPMSFRVILWYVYQAKLERGCPPWRLHRQASPQSSGFSAPVSVCFWKRATSAQPSPRFSRQQMCRQVPSRIFSTPKTACFIEFVQFMFGNQFNIARKVTGHELPPVYVYALETSLQLTLTELNESRVKSIWRHTASRRVQTISTATRQASCIRFSGVIFPRIPSATFTSRTSVRAASCARIWSVRAICILRWKRSSRAF